MLFNIIFWFELFLEARTEILKKISLDFWELVRTMTPKSPFEINWPLRKAHFGTWKNTSENILWTLYKNLPKNTSKISLTQNRHSVSSSIQKLFRGYFQQLRSLPPFRVSKKMVLEKKLIHISNTSTFSWLCSLSLHNCGHTREVKSTHKNMEIITASNRTGAQWSEIKNYIRKLLGGNPRHFLKCMFCRCRQYEWFNFEKSFRF